MKLIILFTLIVLASQTNVQSSAIHDSYDESNDSTEIKTNWLYVMNAPEQFLQLRLVGRFKGRTMPNTGPTALQIEVLSHAVRSHYVVPPDLIAIADGVEIKVGRMTAHPNLRQLGISSGGPPPAGQVMAMRISAIPSSASVVVSNKLQDLSGEWLVTDVSWEALTALAKANKIVWRIGSDNFSFVDIQVARLKQFVAAVTPESGVVVVDKSVDYGAASKPLRPDTPSNANNASLKDTLDWLKRQLSKYSSPRASIYGDPMNLSLTKFNGCHIEWRLSPPSANLDVPGTSRRFYSSPDSFAVDLKDLAPDAVEVNQSGDSLWLYTKDRQKLITLSHWDDPTGRAKPVRTEQLNSVSFDLRKNDLAWDMKAAMTHAIKLCQAVSK